MEEKRSRMFSFFLFLFGAPKVVECAKGYRCPHNAPHPAHEYAHTHTHTHCTPVDQKKQEVALWGG